VVHLRRVETVERRLQRRVRGRPHAVEERLQGTHGGDQLIEVGWVARVTPHDGAHLLQVQLGRERVDRRHGEEGEEAAELLGGRRQELPVDLEHLRRAVEREDMGPASTVETGCRAKVNEVTTPKLPPPRTAQNRSGSWSASARTNLPSARTTSTARRLSRLRPYWRLRWPIPPPRVRPPTPVLEMMPAGVASPNA